MSRAREAAPRLYWYSPRDGVDHRVLGFATFVLGMVLPGRFGFEVAGREHLEAPGGVLVVSNHLSHVDMPFLGIATPPRPLQYVSATKNFTNPLLGYTVSALGAFPLHTDRPDPDGLRHARRQLELGRTVLIFPEGHPTFRAGLDPFMRGAGMLGATPGARVVPAAIWGTHRIVGRGRLPLGRTRVRVAFGPAVVPPGGGSRRERESAITDLARAGVERLLAGLVAMDPDP